MVGKLWIIRTGTPWLDLPDRSSSYRTCHRRFPRWERASTILGALKALAQHLEDCGGVDHSEGLIDATFA